MDKEEIQNRIADMEDELNELDKKPTPEQRLLAILTGCTIERDEKKFPGRIFLMKGGKYFFEIGKSYLWCSYDNVWSVFEEEYCMGYYEIQVLIKNVVEEHFGMDGLTPNLVPSSALKRVEEHFKTKGLTPPT